MPALVEGLRCGNASRALRPTSYDREGFVWTLFNCALHMGHNLEKSVQVLNAALAVSVLSPTTKRRESQRIDFRLDITSPRPSHCRRGASSIVGACFRCSFANGASNETVSTPATGSGSMRFNPTRSGFLGARSADLRAMPAVTRRRYPERQDCWHVYYGDVHVGMIAARCCPQHNHRLSTVLPIYNNRAPQALAAQRSTGKTNGSSAWRSYAIRYFDLNPLSPGYKTRTSIPVRERIRIFLALEISGAHRKSTLTGWMT